MMASTNTGYKHGRTREPPKESFEIYPMIEAVFTYLSYGMLIVIGHITEFLLKIGLKSSRIFKNVNIQ